MKIDPLILEGIRILAPEIALGIRQLISNLSNTKDPVMEAIDKKLSTYLTELATTKSNARRFELEIRIHTLLELAYERGPTI